MIEICRLSGEMQKKSQTKRVSGKICQPPIHQPDYPVRLLCDRRVVGHQQDRQTPFPVHAPQLRHNFSACLAVEIPGRLIRQK